MVSRLSIMTGDFDKYDDVVGETIYVGKSYFHADDADIDSDAIDFFGFPIENTSHQCSSSSIPNFNCPDNKPMHWVILRWMKIIMMEIARSYYAKPLFLMIAPLLFGIIIGFWFGRRWYSEQKIEKKHHQVALLRSEWISIIWFRLGAVASSWFLEDISQPTCVDESLPLSYSTATTVKETVSSNINDMSNSNNCANKDNVDSVSICRISNNNKDVSSNLEIREIKTRTYLKSDDGTVRESGVPVDRVPRHIAVIMDGNRRYGKQKYGNATKGHWDGSSKLVEFAKWCLAERITVLTVFAFSTENWKRKPAEVASLMQIFAKYCDELRLEAIKRNIKIMTLSTDYERIPVHVRIGIKRMVEETQYCDGMVLNICLSYGSRDEIVGATKSVVEDVLQKNLDPKSINEEIIGQRLLTHNCGGDPDVMIRTSGEVRISNFLLWQLAYTELFFIDKPWPAVNKADLLQVIRAYAKGRNRRYGQ
mmetsp:Transcript_44201/g.49884  ORF Transcript_44201/g.49884 Transcript_44201/m.49884 type:complete len:479 (-) Transcript_44201:36-1472(-)